MTLGGGDQAHSVTSQSPAAKFVGVIPIPLATDPLSLNKRLHWATVAKLTREWRSFVLVMARRFPNLDSCDVTLTWYVIDGRRRDVDNMFRLMKALCDGLVDSDVTEDDTADYMTKTCRIERAPKGTPAAYMELRVVER